MRRIVDHATEALLVLLGLVLLAMVALSIWNVVSRYVFDTSVLWADEITVFAMIGMAWLGAIICAWRGMEIRMGIIAEALPEAWQNRLGALHQLVIMLICGWSAWLSWGYVGRLLKFGMRSDGARIPVWIIHASVTLSLGCLAVIAAARLIRILGGKNAAFGPAAAKGVDQ
ncbi:MAG: C4-dicarboxylate transporter DctQ subunit [Sulfitobacter sp.]|jgi:TRAP-type transport system small permease protein